MDFKTLAYDSDIEQEEIPLPDGEATYQWSCKNLILRTPCKARDGTDLHYDRNLKDFSILAKYFELYSIFEF